MEGEKNIFAVEDIEAPKAALDQQAQERHCSGCEEQIRNLEVTLQSLRSQLVDSQSSIQRLESERKRLTKSLSQAHNTIEVHKIETTQLQSALLYLKWTHETTIAQAEKRAAGLTRDKLDLQKTVGALKAEVVRVNKKVPKFGTSLRSGAELKKSSVPSAVTKDEGDIATEALTRVVPTSARKLNTSGMLPPGGFGENGHVPDHSSRSPSPPRQSSLPHHISSEIEALLHQFSLPQRQNLALKGSLSQEKGVWTTTESGQQNGCHSSPTAEHNDIGVRGLYRDSEPLHRSAPPISSEITDGKEDKDHSARSASIPEDDDLLHDWVLVLE